MNSRQRGITLIETIGALGIASMMMLGLTAMIDASLADSEGQQAALYQSQVVAAAKKYIAANYQSLVAATPNPSTIVPVSIATLKTQNFLSSGFAATNAFSQSTCVLVRQTTAGSGKLDALIVTTGGEQIPDKDIPAIASNAGQGSGYIALAAPTTARGASWSLATTPYQGVSCQGGAAVLAGTTADGGHLVSNLFYDGPGQLSTDFLYRDAVPGRPELNQMNTPLKLASNAVVVEGTACGTVAALAVNSANEVMRCATDQTWTAVTSWKKPVANYASLPATDKVGDVRLTLDKNRAFAYNGSTWVALAVDQNGDLAVERDINGGRDIKAAQDLRATRDVYGRDLIASRNVTATTDVAAGRNVTAGQDMTAANNITATKQVRGIDSVRGGYVQADGWVETPELYLTSNYTAGNACHIPTIVNGQTEYILPMGTLVLDQNSLVLVCASDKKLRYPNGKLTPT
jgi:hypothetical protein